ncbi:leucine-rich repeat domain-containing protein [uncultured Porphyromonas sp.]|uniref:leucine-rich repeat domain-containing protein n=1 Tax=uncultured Porphyromonas sp. TaxID=159274 RepID=UPI0025E3AF2A|nr:leucine-rich repeat domain-containing protein [uncultured Porphyromonas sp.]
MKQNYLFLFLLSLLCATSVVAQSDGTKREVTLTEAGTLSQQIPEGEYATLQQLTLKGDINQHDITFVRKNLTELQSFDFAETRILRAERATGSDTFYPADTLFDYALEEMRKLQSVKLPTSLKAIGVKAFYNDIALTEIEIPEGVTSLGGYAFAFCKGLKRATVPGTVKRVESYVFLGCVALEEISLGEGMTKIGGDMFNGCKSLSKIQLPSTIETIEAQSFKGCVLLTELTIPATCQQVGIQILRDCPAMKVITSLATTAPEASTKSFYPEQFDDIELRIPAEALLSYLDSPVWSLFKRTCDLNGTPLSIVMPHGVTTPVALWQAGCLHIAHASGLTIAVYDMAGQLLLQDTPAGETVSYPLPQGLYIVQTPYGTLQAL